MAETTGIRADPSFVRDVIALGGEDLKKCYQCATCSVVCPLAPDDRPYPRKEMIWAQWGAREKLLADPDLWLCYQCNDCSIQCPRGARPGDVMAALRKASIAAWSVPSALGRLVQNQSWFLILLAVPAILFAYLLSLGAGGSAHAFGWAEFANPTLEDGGYKFHNFVPHWMIYSVFVPLSVLVVASFAAGVARMWAAMSSAFPPGERPVASGGLVDVLKDIIVHRHFDRCGAGAWRTWAHLGIFYGFVFLAITTAATIVLMYGFNLPPPLPFSPSHFVDGLLWKIIGNVGALILIAGTIWAIRARMNAKPDDQRSSFGDWAFLAVVLAIAVTGFSAQVLRLWSSGAQSTGLAKAAYATYYVHLVFVFYLIAYAPFCKLAHMVYRTAALAYARRIGRVPRAA